MVHPLGSPKRLFILWLIIILSLLIEIPPFFYLYYSNRGTMFAPLFPVLGICAVSFNVFLTGLYFIFEGFSRNMMSVFIKFYGKVVTVLIPLSLLVAPLEIFSDWSYYLKGGYVILTFIIIIGAGILVLKWTSPQSDEISHQLKKKELIFTGRLTWQGLFPRRFRRSLRASLAILCS
jgi:hypothetical protein